jgi:hypothetical protein
MKKMLIGVILGLIVSQSVFAKEDASCQYSYDTVERKVNILNEKKSSLSQMAIKKLYGDLTFEVTQCIGYCDGKKFDYCNKIAKEIESK